MKREYLILNGICICILGILLSCSRSEKSTTVQLVNLTESAQTGYTQKSLPFPVKRYCQTLRLKDDPELIQEYIARHQKVWPKVLEGIKQVGVVDHEIYIHNNLLFMILVTPIDFDFDKQMSILATMPRQQEWEALMSKYQASSADASSAEKWQRMERVFKLN